MYIHTNNTTLGAYFVHFIIHLVYTLDHHFSIQQGTGIEF